MNTRHLWPALMLAALGSPLLAGPVSQQQVDAAITRIEAMAQDMVKTGKVPGIAIGVVHDDKVVWSQGFGVRRMNALDPVDADTIFQIASLSKPVSATVVASLVGQGLMGWDSRIRDLDPGFALYDPYTSAEVTLRDMFGHLSGTPGSAGNDLESIGYDRDTVMRRLRLVPPWVSFRGGYSYSNAAFTEGGVAAAKAAGKDWESLAQDELFGPLGMDSSSYRYADFQKRSDVAALHVWQGEWVPLVQRDPTAQAPAGSVTSSVNDLTRWMRMLLAKGRFDGAPVIAPEALAATQAPHWSRGQNPITGGQSFYGIGWAVEIGRHGTVWQHAGAFSDGAQTVVKLLPDSQIGIVVLSNAFPNPAPDGLADSFVDLALDGELAADYVTAWGDYYSQMFLPDIDRAKATYGTPPDPATPALPAAAYAGQYGNDYVGEATIEAGGYGDLTLIMGPQGAKRFPLSHFDRDLFTYFPDAEMPDRPSAARFTIGADGRAASVTLENVDANGLGTLSRIEPPQEQASR